MVGTVWPGARLLGSGYKRSGNSQNRRGSCHALRFCDVKVVCLAERIWVNLRSHPVGEALFDREGNRVSRKLSGSWWAAEPEFQPKSLGLRASARLTVVRHQLFIRGSGIQLSPRLPSSLPGRLISGWGSEIFSSPCDLLRAEGTGRLRVA